MENKTKRIFIPGSVRGKEFTEDQKEFDFIISSEKRDSYGTIFMADGWDYNRYQENPVVFYQHRSSSNDPDDLIGTTVKGPWEETLEDGTRVQVARVRFEDGETNPKAEKIRKKIIAGTIRMASIGADVHQYRWGDKEKNEDAETLYFTRTELFEWSVVNIGSNSDASVKRSETMEEIKSEFKTVGKDPEPEKRDHKEEKNKGISHEVARLSLVKYKYK